MKCTLRSTALAAAILVLVAAPAVALPNASIVPSSQSHNYGVASNWTVFWSNAAKPINGRFTYGDSTYTDFSSSSYPSGSRGFSHTYYPCVNRNYTQTVSVGDYSYPINPQDTSTARENGGTLC